MAKTRGYKSCEEPFPNESILLLAGVLALSAQMPSEQLKSPSLPHTTITAADSIPTQASFPACCRAAAMLKPSTDCDIKIEVLLPANFKTLNFDSDLARGVKRDGATLSAPNSDLRPFFSHGGNGVHARFSKSF